MGAHHHPRRVILLSALLGALASLLRGRDAPAAAVAGLGPSRRGATAGALLSGLLPTTGLSLAAQAEVKQGWQLRLPPTWKVYDQKGVPGLNEAAPRQLLLAGNPNQKAEVKVVRAPLATSERDPQGLGGLALIEYFSSNEPRVTRPQAVDVLSKGFSSQPAIFSFSLSDDTSEKYLNSTKYLRYDFDAARCEGAQIQSVNGKICQRSDNGEELPVLERHHAILSTVVAEPTKGQVADGLLVGPNGAEVLWVVDVSAPSGNWTQLTEEVKTIMTSFSVGSEEQLTTTREKVTGKAS